MKGQKSVTAFLVSGLVGVFFASMLGGVPNAQAGEGKRIAKQMTVTSIKDPIPGHGAHQVAILLPPVEGQMYTGTLTYTASKPAEVVVFHDYRPAKPIGAEHGEVATGVLNGKTYAISVMQFSNDVQVTNSATVPFSGNALALHTLNGDKFSATVSIHAILESLTP